MESVCAGELRQKFYTKVRKLQAEKFLLSFAIKNDNDMVLFKEEKFVLSISKPFNFMFIHLLIKMF
jgi:hypothetical protein